MDQDLGSTPPGLKYHLDFSGPFCSCPDFKSYRQELKVGDLSRCCKHLMRGYATIRPKNGWPEWLDSFLEAGFRPVPGQKWRVIVADETPVLISSASKGWANVYVDSAGEKLKFGYNINEDRWAYGKIPSKASMLAVAIKELSS